ncbi:hypothetical protein ACFQAT_06615 [Undibacterium arcticum]|uniref:DUF485 domain-containing protein n=1 Tax=Undibacterium arcticum TaxID=1762892 RepID=A0ABV7F4P3_9BURK
MSFAKLPVLRRSVDVTVAYDAVLVLVKRGFCFLKRHPMLYRPVIGQRLVALFVLGWLLFNYPLLALFNDAGTLFGIPLLFAYLFVVWALFIGLLAFIVEQKVLGKNHALVATSAPALKD